MKKLILIVTAVLVIPLLLGARTEGGQEKGKHFKKEAGKHLGGMAWKRLDTNQDGSISREEFTSGWLNFFQKVDADGNGVITKEEAEKARKAFLGEAREKALEHLKKLDTNGDGKITQDEFKGREQIFQRLDTNHDGAITQDEFLAGMKKVEEYRPHIFPRMLERLDTNKDGALSKEEFQQGINALFERLDRNGDGLLNREDWKRGPGVREPAIPEKSQPEKGEGNQQLP